MPPKRTQRKKVKKPQAGRGVVSAISGGITSAQNVYRKTFGNGKSRPLLAGEHHYGLHNFTGPGTRIDLPEVRNFRPYNGIDACSKQHDIDYLNAKDLPPEQKARAIHAADVKALACYDRHKNDNGYTAAKAGIKLKHVAESTLSAVKGTPTVLYGGRKRKVLRARPKSRLPRRNAAGQFVKA